MNRNNFWNTHFSNSEYDKSTEEVQHINQVFSTIAAQDIPTEKRSQVSESPSHWIWDQNQSRTPA